MPNLDVNESEGPGAAGGLKLRNHIPLGAPATREPVTGDEPPVRVSLGFTLKWFNSRLGIDLGRRWHFDPTYRYRCLAAMRRCVLDAFPGVELFSRPEEELSATISGVLGGCVIPAAYGLSIEYWPDKWPAVTPGSHLSKEVLMRARCPDLGTATVVEQLLAQMDTIETEWGPIRGYLNYQGVLNNALRIRGNDIFTDFIDDPPFVDHLLGRIADSMFRLAKLIQARQRKSGFPVDLFSVSNCTVNMISPRTYERFVLPHDLGFIGQFQRFGVHNCNWCVDPYLEPYSKIGRIGYLDMGVSSNLVRARELFPDARLAVIYGPVDLELKPLDLVESDVRYIYESLGPCDIVMADVEVTTPDSRVKEFLEICDRVPRECASYF